MTTESFRALELGEWLISGGTLCEVVELVNDSPRRLHVKCWGAKYPLMIREEDASKFELTPKPLGDPSPPPIPDANHPVKIRLSFCTDEEMDRVMSELDREMAVDGVPIIGRELQAVSYLCRKYHFSLALHEPLFRRMADWCVDRYGARLNIDMNLCFPVLIGQDIYKIKASPFLAGYAICAREESEGKGKFEFNVLDLIQDLTPKRRSLITNADLYELGSTFRERLTNQTTIGKVRNERGFIEGFGDLQTAKDVLFQARPQLGGSRWSSLQATEKYLKAWLRRKKKKGWGHELIPLAEEAEPLGLPTVSRADIALVQCGADVRYDASRVTCREAVDAFHASCRICAHIVTNLGT